MKRFHILFITKSHYTLPKRSPRVTFQLLRGQLNDFPKNDFMPFKLINPQSTVHSKRYHYTFKIWGYHNILSKRFHINDFLYYIQDHTSFIHIHSWQRCFSLLSQGFIFILFMYNARLIGLPKEESLYYHLITCTI